MARFLFIAIALVFSVCVLSEMVSAQPSRSGPALSIQDAQQHLIGNNKPQQANCKKIGAFCSVSEECCTRRCHSYRAKCVS